MPETATQMAKTVVLTFSPLPTTPLLLSAFRAAPMAANSAIHELDSTDEATLQSSLSGDGMIICAGSLASVAHLLAPNQRAFFDATEDSFLFRTLLAPCYPNYNVYKSSTPWTTELDWNAGRKYVVKPNIGYSSVDTFVVKSPTEQAALVSLISNLSNRDFVIEEFIDGLFLCADVVVDGQTILITSVYQRYDYGIKETAQYHASNLYRTYKEKFREFTQLVVIECLPLPPQTRVMFNVEAKLGSDGVLRCVEINPFRACGVAPIAASEILGRNVFELAFAGVVEEEVEVREGEKEIVAAFARKEGESAKDLLPPLLKDLFEQDGAERTAVEVSVLLEEKDKATFEIHDGRIFELKKRD